MKTFIIIYLTIGILWDIFVMYSTITEKFLSEDEKETLNFIKEFCGEDKKKYGLFLIVSAISELILWPISWIKYGVKALIKN